MIELEKYYKSNDGLDFYVHSEYRSSNDNNRSCTAYVILVKIKLMTMYLYVKNGTSLLHL